MEYQMPGPAAHGRGRENPAAAHSRFCLTALLLAAMLALTSCQPPDTRLILVDADTGLPVEGGWVYGAGEMTVHRSDVRGEVDLPEGFGPEGMTVFAKGYGSLDLAPATAPGTVELRLDDALVNHVESGMVFDRADTLRGAYGPFRENNDLLSYDLNIVVEPERAFISGWNTIRFRMLADASRIQIDLFANMSVDSILHAGERLPFSRDFNAVFIDFPGGLEQGDTYSIDFHYSGHPLETGRFGGMTFSQDSLGNPWIFTACQGIGASLWWPNKDQQPDEVNEMTMSITVPTGLVDVSNGKLMEVHDQGDGTTRYRWKVHYPINNYSVSVNIAEYTHFADTLGILPLDYYVLPYHLDDARRQFSQAKPMLQCFQDRFGEFPFPEDGYKLVEVPYSGMEHQSAVTYGNRFQNGYLERDWTGVGISTRFDFIIIHESGHEWYGNSVTANDVSDAWIHEGWDTWAEAVYVECMWGYEDAITYVNGYKEKVGNEAPIIGPPGVNHWPTQDQYFKGALFMNTLRHVVDDETTWWSLIRDYTDHFKHRNIWTTDVINFFNTRLGWDFRPIFQQYLLHPNLPVLEIQEDEDRILYRWRADVEDFDMPVKVRSGRELRTIHPTTEWQVDPLNGADPSDWVPATELFYIDVERDLG